MLGTGSINNPNIAKTISQKYGNQSIIQSIDCRKTNALAILNMIHLAMAAKNF